MTHDEIKSALKAAIEKTPRDELQYLTFTSLLNMAGKDADIGILMHVVPELVTDKTLTQHGVFFDQDGTEWEISDAELNDAFNTGVFIHPDTGEHVKKSEISFYYSAKD